MGRSTIVIRGTAWIHQMTNQTVAQIHHFTQRCKEQSNYLLRNNKVVWWWMGRGSQLRRPIMKQQGGARSRRTPGAGAIRWEGCGFFLTSLSCSCSDQINWVNIRTQLPVRCAVLISLAGVSHWFGGCWWFEKCFTCWRQTGSIQTKPSLRSQPSIWGQISLMNVKYMKYSVVIILKYFILAWAPTLYHCLSMNKGP